uniref:Uncharacterized protein n=1 Tax=Oryza meridionalis TaxID=40149 RepID=A0A0E0DNF6_9ORYZ
MGLARFLCRSGGELAEGEMKRTNCMYPRTEVRCPSPARRRRSICFLASVVAGRREQSKLAAPAAAAAASSGSELQLFGEGGRRHHRHAGGGADHAVVHPWWADGRPASGDGPAEEPVVEAGARAGAVVAERARGGVVVEVADLRRVVVVRRDVLAREAIDAHQLHYRLGDGVLDAEVRHRVDEPLVQLRRRKKKRDLGGVGVAREDETRRRRWWDFVGGIGIGYDEMRCEEVVVS